MLGNWKGDELETYQVTKFCPLIVAEVLYECNVMSSRGLTIMNEHTKQKITLLPVNFVVGFCFSCQ